MTDTDPTEYPHHWIARKKGRTAVRARSFHLTQDCPTLGRLGEDSELVDLDPKVVEFLNLEPCGTCVRGVMSHDSTGAIAGVLGAVRVSAPAAPVDLVAELLVQELLFRGFKIVRSRSVAERPESSPLDAWLEGASGLEAEGSGLDDLVPEGLEDTVNDPAFSDPDASLGEELEAHMHAKHDFMSTGQTPAALATIHTEMHDTGMAGHDLFDLTS